MLVIDLDKFSLEEIWRPFQSMKGHERRLTAPAMNLDGTAKELLTDWIAKGEWSRCVIDRLSCIGVTFPAYVQHPLVYIVKGCIAAHKGAPAVLRSEAKMEGEG